MLCPSCQKKLSKLLHEKLTKSRSAVERIRICSCGFKFKSFERAEKEIVKDYCKIAKRKLNEVGNLI